MRITKDLQTLNPKPQICRGYEREEAETYALLEKLRETDPAVGYSHPKWLWGRWAKE